MGLSGLTGLSGLSGLITTSLTPFLRRGITITGTAAGAQTNFTLEIELPWDSDMQADFSDVHFRAADGTTLLGFWLETKTDSVTATFWVKVPSIPASPDTVVIYAYYGDTSPTSSSILRGFLDGDDFNRANLNDPTSWSKSGSNPLTAAGFGDPGAYHEDSTFYVFVDNLTSDDIDVFSSADGTTLASQGEMLAKGAATAWDDFFIRDPFVLKAGDTYHMWYGGQVDTGGGATTHKIGHATASDILGPWTKDGSNPVLDLSGGGDGCNEPSVRYDADAPAGQEFAMLYTFGNGGNKDDVGTGDIGLAYSADGTTWSDQGAVIPGGAITYQDQEQIQDTDGIWHAFVTVSAGQDIQQAQSNDHENWGIVTAGGGLDSGATYDVVIFAASLVFVDSTYYLYFQADDGGGNQTIAVATSSALTGDGWVNQATDIFTISSNAMTKTGSTGGGGSWGTGGRLFPKAPPLRDGSGYKYCRTR